jgi:hypothetical protein
VIAAISQVASMPRKFQSVKFEGRCHSESVAQIALPALQKTSSSSCFFVLTIKTGTQLHILYADFVLRDQLKLLRTAYLSLLITHTVLLREIAALGRTKTCLAQEEPVYSMILLREIEPCFCTSQQAWQ